MWLFLEMLMENSSARLVKQTNRNLCFGLVVKVIIVLVLMPKSLLACWGGGAVIDPSQRNITENETFIDPPGVLDDTFKVNLTGIKDPVERNIKTAWNGWEPSEKTKKEWKDWYEAWKVENMKNGEGKGGKGKDGDGGRPVVPDDNRGPGSGWPKLPGWADLGNGNPGNSPPPWAFVPKNIGKPSICYLPPIEGECRPNEDQGSPGPRFGFNPYTNECESYVWSGCGGTRNRFVTKEKCEEHCNSDPPKSCSIDSGIPDKQHGHPFDKLN